MKAPCTRLLLAFRCHIQAAAIAAEKPYVTFVSCLIQSRCLASLPGVGLKADGGCSNRSGMAFDF
jgi:hypothetical protein